MRPDTRGMSSLIFETHRILCGNGTPPRRWKCGREGRRSVAHACRVVHVRDRCRILRGEKSRSVTRRGSISQWGKKGRMGAKPRVARARRGTGRPGRGSTREMGSGYKCTWNKALAAVEMRFIILYTTFLRGFCPYSRIHFTAEVAVSL